MEEANLSDWLKMALKFPTEGFHFRATSVSTQIAPFSAAHNNAVIHSKNGLVVSQSNIR